MNHKEIVKQLQERLEWEATEVTEMLSLLNSHISQRLLEQDTVNLQGFGQFESKKKNERISVNPANGKRYLIPPKLSPVFRPGNTVKNIVKELKPHE